MRCTSWNVKDVRMPQPIVALVKQSNIVHPCSNVGVSNCIKLIWLEPDNSHPESKSSADSNCKPLVKSGYSSAHHKEPLTKVESLCLVVQVNLQDTSTDLDRARKQSGKSSPTETIWSQTWNCKLRNGWFKTNTGTPPWPRVSGQRGGGMFHVTANLFISSAVFRSLFVHNFFSNKN